MTTTDRGRCESCDRIVPQLYLIVIQSQPFAVCATCAPVKASA